MIFTAELQVKHMANVREIFLETVLLFNFGQVEFGRGRGVLGSSREKEEIRFVWQKQHTVNTSVKNFVFNHVS